MSYPMTYAQLRAKMIDQSHRKDMVARVPEFIEDARTRLNMRLGIALLPFINDDDTNDVLTRFPLLYFYAGMVALYNFIIEMETADYFEQLYRAEVDSYYITRAGTEPLTITPEVPAP